MRPGPDPSRVQGVSLSLDWISVRVYIEEKKKILYETFPGVDSWVNSIGGRWSLSRRAQGRESSAGRNRSRGR